MVSVRASDALMSISELEDRVRKLVRRNGNLESWLKGSFSRFKRLRWIKQTLRSRISYLESTNQDLDEELTSLKKDVIGQHERGF